MTNLDAIEYVWLELRKETVMIVRVERGHLAVDQIVDRLFSLQRHGAAMGRAYERF